MKIDDNPIRQKLLALLLAILTAYLSDKNNMHHSQCKQCNFIIYQTIKPYI